MDWNLKPARDHGLSFRERLRSVRREAGLLEAGAQLIWWSFVRACLTVFHRLEIRGRDHVPRQPPFILVSNHASHLDAAVLASAVPFHLRIKVFPIAAGDTFFETPAVAAFSALVLNALPMWRRRCGPHVMQSLRERLLDEPCAYLVFPEGTRTRTGAMGGFRPGVGMLVAGTSVPVVPCNIQGSFEALPPRGIFPRFKKVRLTIGAAQVFADVADDRPGWESIALRLEASVRSLGSR